MPRRNRVQPDGTIIAHPARGLYMGNRGILHQADGTLSNARWRHKAWVTCLLKFKNRHRQLMAPNHYTELFFLDEAVAFAAGHRPCGECRRTDYSAFRDAAGITGRIADYDAMLHQSRALPRVFGQRRFKEDIANLPDGTFILNDSGQPAVVNGHHVLPYTPAGYAAPLKRPAQETVTVLTPEVLLAPLRAGYRLQMAESA